MFNIQVNAPRKNNKPKISIPINLIKRGSFTTVLSPVIHPAMINVIAPYANSESGNEMAKTTLCVTSKSNSPNFKYAIIPPDKTKLRTRKIDARALIGMVSLTYALRCFILSQEISKLRINKGRDNLANAIRQNELNRITPRKTG